MKPLSQSGSRLVGTPNGTSEDAPDSSVLEMRPIRNDAFAAGEVIAEKYVVERVIGTGGVGIVLAAKHRELDETVAIKFLRPEVQAKREIVDRFAREAKAAVRIKSEYAARVYDVGIVAGRGPYLVMEYLEGKDIADVLNEGGRFTIKRAVEYVMQTCEALACAHAAGIIHRDIKPENLFLARRADGTELIKVLDFGISKSALTGSVFDRDVSLVKTQDLMGSPLYMSPEQVRSTGTVDHRTDIWSLGVVLYELITGRVPFDGKTITKICAAVLEQDPPPLNTYVPDPPAGLQEVLDRCLQKDRAKRFQNVAELAIALLPFAPSLARVFAERTSGILRASGQPAPIALKMESSMPPPSGSAGVVSVPTPAALPTISTHPRIGAATTDPEALGAIAREAQKTRRVVIAASVLVLALVGVTTLFILRRAAAPVGAVSAQAVPGPLLHQVSIESDPIGARVEWQGRLVGETPVDVQLPPGVHALHIAKDGYTPENLTVTVAADDSETRSSRVTLRRLSPTPNTPQAGPTAPQAAAAPRALPGPAAPNGPPPVVGRPLGHPGRPPLPTPVAVAPPTTSAAPPPPPPAPSPGPTATTTSTAPTRVKLLDDNNRVRILDDKKDSPVPLVQ
jgi:serine/threonine-protein kinase